MKVFVALCLFALVAADLEVDFNNWRVEHNKPYASRAEYLNRFQAWMDNLEIVNAHNVRGKSFTLGMNHLADLTNDEYRAIYLNVPYDVEVPETVNSVANKDLPASYDWREHGAVTDVKDQGQCGSCWSFSSSGAAEGAHFLGGNPLIRLSEQQQMDCSWSYGNMGCNGGNMGSALNYVKAKGLESEEDYPYKEASSYTCHYEEAKVKATLQSVEAVKVGDENALQEAVAQGPVSIGIDASHNSFQLYKSGVYDEPQCSSTRLDHGVLAIGWGSSNGQDYWLVKNSWNTIWGNQGYIWMSRNKNNQCGVATQANLPKA